MTTAARRTEPLDGRPPTEDESESAETLHRVLTEATSRARADDEPIEIELIIDREPTKIVVPRTLLDLLLDTLRTIGAGDAVSLVPTHPQLSTQQAADLLGVSRPHLVKLLEAGEIPFGKVGKHRRVLVRDLLDYRARRVRERDAALGTLAENDGGLL